jgi:hypothetical protein
MSSRSETEVLVTNLKLRIHNMRVDYRILKAKAELLEETMHALQDAIDSDRSGSKPLLDLVDEVDDKARELEPESYDQIRMRIDDIRAEIRSQARTTGGPK